jgi:hypothetical protein
MSRKNQKQMTMLNMCIFEKYFVRVKNCILLWCAQGRYQQTQVIISLVEKMLLLERSSGR